MGHIPTDEHGWFPYTFEAAVGRWVSGRSAAPKLCVDFHQHIGIVLGIALDDLRQLHDLGNNTVTAVARFLDAGVMK